MSFVEWPIFFFHESDMMSSLVLREQSNTSFWLLRVLSLE
jgi:hypothetical protein